MVEFIRRGESCSIEKRKDPEGYPNIERAMDRADRDIFSQAIDPRDFIHDEDDEASGPYDRKMVEKDLLKVEALSREMALENAQGVGGDRFQRLLFRRLGRAFEAITLFNVDENLWFGDSASVIIPSRFDDYINGVDGIIEIAGEMNTYSNLALGIDVTFGGGHTLSRKSSRIAEEIVGKKDSRGRVKRLSTIKYYSSKKRRFKGSLEQVPRLLVVTEPAVVKELMDLWVEKKNGSLGKHPFQIEMLCSFLAQLNLMKEYASKVGWSEGGEIFSQYLSIVEIVLNQKRGQLGSDFVNREIQKTKRSFAYSQVLECFNQSFR